MIFSDKKKTLSTQNLGKNGELTEAQREYYIERRAEFIEALRAKPPEEFVDMVAALEGLKDINSFIDGNSERCPKCGAPCRPQPSR